MAEVYVGQIMMTGFNFAPKGMAFCNGQLISITQNTALFSLLGTSYGGNGTSTFQLPNLQGMTPVGQGASADPNWQPSPYTVGVTAGTETVTLLSSQMPAHTHLVGATTAVGNSKNPTNAGLGASTNSAIPVYAPSGSEMISFFPKTLAPTGGSTAHSNMQPFKVISFSIALKGIFPARN